MKKSILLNSSSILFNLGMCLVVIAFVLITLPPQKTAPVCESGAVIVPTATVEVEPSPVPSGADFVYDPVITPVSHYGQPSESPQPFLQMMPGGQIIDVRERIVCQETDVFGGPRYDSTIRGHLLQGDKVVSHEIVGDWVMLRAAHWVPGSALCSP